jgi:acylphosphatase
VAYIGRVQGVGFRYTALHLAKNFAVAGTVRNCDDGSVELIAEGEADQVDGFLAAIMSRMRGYIEEQIVSDVPVTQRRGFHIIS